MNFRPYDTEATVWETYPEQKNLSDIPEESESCDTDFTFAKSIAKGLDIQQQMNDCMRLSGTRFKSDLEIFLKNGFSAKPDVANVFEELIKVLRSICLSEKANCPENDEKPRSPVPPERSDDAPENSRPESKTMNHRELEVAGEVGKPQLNGFAEPKPQQKLEPHFVFTPKTTNPFPINNVFDSKLEDKQPESIDASSSSDWFASLRLKLQDSLSVPGKNLFDFNANKFSDPVSFKIHDNNPFRNYMSANKPSTFEQAANNQPKNSPTTFGLFTKNSNLESQPQIVYESGPVLYNGGRNNSSNERNSQMNEIMKERQKLIESKRVNVESWIEHGANSNNNHSNNSMPFSAFQTQNNRVPNGTTDNPVYFNGTSTAPNNASRSLEKVTSEKWLDMVASAIDFNKNEKTSSRPEISRPKGIQETLGNKRSTGPNNKLDLDNKTARNQSHSVFPNTPSNGLAYFQDGSGRLVWSVKKILISNRFVFLIIYRNEAWMAIEEFAAAFTNMSSDTMLKILSIQRVDIPFLKISRAENCSLFNELDGTSVNVPRDCCNKIDEFLNLVPLKSALKILNKLNIVKGKQVLRATKDQVFPEESPALFDIRTVINAWGQFQQEYSLST